MADDMSLTEKMRMAAKHPAGLQIVSNCSPIHSDLEAMPNDQEISLGFVAEDLKQIRAAIAKARGQCQP